MQKFVLLVIKISILEINKMSENIVVLKDENNQIPIPSIWRETLFNIVEALKDGDFRIQRGINGVLQISKEDALRIERNLEAYGAQLISLPEETWDSSVCQWMNSYWDVLVDLYTMEEGASDLALFVRVSESDSSYFFDIQSVHVA